MKTAMESIKEMVDVNTIVGDAVETGDGTVIIPISRVTFGFAAGGGDYEPEETVASGSTHPFGGGSGAGVSVRPVGFLVCSPTSGVRFMPVEGPILYERLIDMVPQALGKIQEMMRQRGQQDDLEALANTAETQSGYSPQV
jgi:sporulation protein YtfJ